MSSTKWIWPMASNVSTEDAGFKALELDPTEFLQGAYDSGDPVTMAMVILAHPLSPELSRQTITRLYRIGYLNALPAPTEIKGMRRIAAVILDMEAAR